MAINWRECKHGEQARVGLLMKWPGYENQVNSAAISLDGPFVCFKIQGNTSYWSKLPNETRTSGLDSYGASGYALNLDISDYSASLLWADPVKKPTIIISED